ncbi:MAG TPA: hypothetical protein VHR45_23290 [Thermoanaerobaculia bacterium]|nr:hypothetical protein [Thermoanaerobaculia bacterium]
MKACALSGFLMTLLYVSLSIVPIIEVKSRAQFAAKISGLIALTNILGLAIYRAARKRREAAPADTRLP